MKGEKMTIPFTRFVTRPATQQDVDEQNEWLEKHPGGYSEPYVLGEDIEVEETVELPGKYEVCDRCDGKGTHTNPNIDGNGITSDEWHNEWSEEEREHYLEGWYDVTCYECGGKRVVLEVDEDACDKELLEQYNQHLDSLAEQRAEERYWRRMESGGYDY